MPVRVEPAGWTTSPAGLSTTSRCSSSHTIGIVDRLGLRARVALRDLRRDLLPALEPVALRPALAVDEHRAGGDQPLGERARVELRALGEDAVEPGPGLAAQERERGAVPRRGLVRSDATNEAKSSPTPTTMKVSARLNAGQ